ncbi:MAG: DinB family protein [Acidimicrobiales bacterium]
MHRPEPPPIPRQADERTTLNAFLDFYRAALLDRAHGLSATQLRASLPPSTLSLSRLIGHMAFVEAVWFRERFDGDAMPEPWASLDFAADHDAEMTLAQSWSREQLVAVFEEAVADARARVTRAASLDDLSSRTHPSGEHWSLRWILVHMIEEYARHCGHADLIRESIDGDTLG